MRCKKACSVAIVAALGVFAQSGAAHAAYPERPLRLIVAYPAGSSTNDILGRALADRLTDKLGQQVVVENRPGAGGTIGTSLAAQAEPDGYTLLLGANGPMSISPNVLKLSYDPRKDFEPVTLFALVPYVITANPSLPAKNLKELVALAKQKPGKVRYASAGIASTPHLCGELLKLNTDTNMLHVPYRGGAPATIDLIAGHVDLYCAGAPGQAGPLRAGQTQGLAVAWKNRLPGMPEVPTAAEQGVKGLEVASWNGVLAPKGTPKEIVEKLNRTIIEIVKEPKFREFLVKQGVEVVTDGPREFSRFIGDELDKWGEVIRKAKVRVQQ